MEYVGGGVYRQECAERADAIYGVREAVGHASAVRIHLKSGATIDAESWSEQDEVLLYTQAGVTYGVPRGDVARLEDAQGRPIELKSTAKGSDDVFQCRTPQVGDSESTVLAFFRCLGATPSFRTRIWEGRQATVYTIPPRSGRQRELYWVVNGRLTQVEVGGSP